MNDYIAVEYQLFIKGKDDDEERLQEQRTDEQPFVFITDLNTVLPAFEKNVAILKKGDKMDFHVLPQDAYGVYNEELVLELPTEKFLDDKGALDEQLFFVGNVIALQNTEGQTFNAVILDIDNKVVTVDLNHPRAGISMHFIGKVIEHRPATEDELNRAIEASKRSCGCGGCGSGCNSVCGGCCDSGCAQ